MSAVVARLAGVPASVRIASVNVNGIRAAVRKGMIEWLAGADVDVMALQEVRANADELAAALPGWHIVGNEAEAKGRAGVAIAARIAPADVRTALGDGGTDAAGRWIEADYEFGGERLTVVSAYVHTGEAGTPRQAAKYAFLDAMEERMPRLQAHAPLSLIMGDLNVGHTQRDIRNWKGNVKNAGFLPRERAYFDRFVGQAGMPVNTADGATGTGLGWVDVGRQAHGDVDGPYTWWSMRGRAFDNDTGWRIDYHLATPDLAARASGYSVVRAPSWDTRWSDHAPVVADYRVGA
ncbi:exodeoxyribonuclease III [Microbacterium awajiense]|uniref:Exodeoxyribonuclease III n=1 Tax=Microbacterium awajiense TaxID=415214 RepID=A0ABP7AG83_9MICO